MINLFSKDIKNQERITNILILWAQQNKKFNINEFLLFLDLYCKSVTIERNENESNIRFATRKQYKINEYLKLRDKVIDIMESDPSFKKFNPNHIKLWQIPKCTSNNFPFAQLFSESKTKPKIYNIDFNNQILLKDIFYSYENTHLSCQDWEQFDLRNPTFLTDFLDFFHTHLHLKIENNSIQVENYTKFVREILIRIQNIFKTLHQTKFVYAPHEVLKKENRSVNRLDFGHKFNYLKDYQVIPIDAEIISPELLSCFSLPAVLIPPENLNNHKDNPVYSRQRQNYWDKFNIENYVHIPFKDDSFVIKSDIKNSDNLPNFYLRYEILDNNMGPRKYLTTCPYSLSETRLEDHQKHTFLEIDEVKLEIWKSWLKANFT